MSKAPRTARYDWAPNKWARAGLGAESVEGKRKACAKCSITYMVWEGYRSDCPLCRSEKQNAVLNIALQDANEKLRNVQRSVGVLKAQVDHVHAIKDALEIIGPDDLGFLKGVLYCYREDRSISMLAMSDATGSIRRRSSAPRTRFVVTQQGRDNETHVCTSAGGMAIVGYYDELIREVGAAQAMAYLLRALSQTLVGGSR